MEDKSLSAVKQTAKKRSIGDGVAGPGRKKGVPNKTTRSVKEAISLAAERLGGTDRLVAWAQEDPANERAFWTSIYPKLLPLQVAGDPNAPLTINVITRRIIRPE